MENSKERQLDSVFTAKEAGEYRFCFNNEMSTFAEKLVDFEIAVRSTHFLVPKQPLSVTANITAMLRPTSVYPIDSIEIYPLTPTLSTPGRKRITLRPPPLQTRHLPRTNLRSRRIHHESLPRPLHYQPEPEILPHSREPKFQHC